MSKAFGKLFGSKSTSYNTSSTPTGYQSLSPEAQQTYDYALQSAKGLSPSSFGMAPITSQQQQAADYFATPISMISPEQFQSGISMFSNPFEEQVLKNTIADLNQQAQAGYRDIASIASDYGGFGSNRRGLLEAELQSNLLDTVGDISASSRAANFENAAARTLAEIGRVDALNQQNAASLFDIGTQIQNTNTSQAQAEAAYYDYLAQMAARLAGGGGTSSGTAYGPSQGLLNNDLVKSGVTAGLGMIGFSDVRIKEDIQPVGQLNGFNLYTFKYKGFPTKFLGVIAQEIEKILPAAVSEIDGIKRVDYSKLGFAMEVVHA